MSPEGTEDDSMAIEVEETATSEEEADRRTATHATNQDTMHITVLTNSLNHKRISRVT